VYRRRLQPLDLAVLDREARTALRDSGEFPVTRYRSVREDLKSFPLVVYLQDLLAVTADVPELARLRQPTLALLSIAGVLTDPVVTEELLARLPNCHVEKFTAKHWIPTEQPEAMRRAIEDFARDLVGQGEFN
jgi:pimeloyl-ACP methyl ester carboxylesterase